jgi:hypothetical protein
VAALRSSLCERYYCEVLALACFSHKEYEEALGPNQTAVKIKARKCMR